MTEVGTVIPLKTTKRDSSRPYAKERPLETLWRQVDHPIDDFQYRSFSDGMMTITSEKRDEEEEKKQDCFLSERSRGPLKRSLRVADDINTGIFEAAFNYGALTSSLPKTNEARKIIKTIALNKGGSLVAGHLFCGTSR